MGALPKGANVANHHFSSLKLNTRRSAFALLKTIIALVLVAALLQALSVRSLEVATDAKRAEQDSQRRWAAVTTRLTLLSNAPKLLSPLGDTQPIAFATRDTAFTLGDVAVEARVADEQAKAHVGTLQRELDATRVDEVLREAAARDGLGAYFVIPAVTKTRNSRAPGAGAVSSDVKLGAWTEIFPGLDDKALFNTVGRGGVLDRFTLWGSGQLNIQSAEPEVIRAFVGHAINDAAVTQALVARTDGPRRHPYQVLRSVGVKSEDADQVEDNLIPRSQCYSVLLRLHQGGWSGGEFVVRQLDADRADGWNPGLTSWVRSSTRRFVWE